MPRGRYPKPLVFHDGRLAFLPTPIAMLAITLWLPFGILVAIIRIFVGIFLPYKVTVFVCALSGKHLRVKGYDNLREKKTEEGRVVGGVLFVCTHRTLLDPFALTLTMVVLDTNVTMFYGSTASGLKWLDPIYFLMNPRPIYHVQVLEKLAKGLTCGLGNKSSHEALTTFRNSLPIKLTRRDKYLILVGNQGVVDDGKDILNMVLFGLLEHQALCEEQETTRDQNKCTRRGINSKSGGVRFTGAILAPLQAYLSASTGQ
ncbi:glycerol-3-phosphate acyltransferase 1 [Artemisia annua]|uniref:Glycerol-3-phosphate acyltransferase 1 n=1 Tax=Artemisia annua TaxID=35608 RepID=A0A2U1KYT6_ARTAN|nr:glycerol-3-phosphate acyltransferase 1 [Artemisia annua]